MHSRTLKMPELMFIIATRAALAGGVALLLSGKLSKRQRKVIGTTLVAFGAITTIPAGMIMFRTRDRAPEKVEP
jgi:hypothetical protein